MSRWTVLTNANHALAKSGLSAVLSGEISAFPADQQPADDGPQPVRHPNDAQQPPGQLQQFPSQERWEIMEPLVRKNFGSALVDNFAASCVSMLKDGGMRSRLFFVCNSVWLARASMTPPVAKLRSVVKTST